MLWGGWLVVTGLVFSYMSGIIHPYYTVALAPAIGALIGIGAAGAVADPAHLVRPRPLAAALAVTAAWAWVLLGRSPGWLPWLRVVIVIAAAGAAGLILAGPRRGPATARGRTALAAAPVSLAVIAGLGGPLAYSIDTAATSHGGSIPSAGPTVTAPPAAPAARGIRPRRVPAGAGGSSRRLAGQPAAARPGELRDHRHGAGRRPVVGRARRRPGGTRPGPGGTHRLARRAGPAARAASAAR